MGDTECLYYCLRLEHRQIGKGSTPEGKEVVR